MTWKIHAVILPFLAFFCILAAPKAQACRDCVFPMKIGDKQWLMPDKQTVVMIEERWYRDAFLMDIVLLDMQTGNIIAEGSVRRKIGQRSVQVVLNDRDGRKVNGAITWVNYKDKIIRAKFSCESENCSLYRRN